MSDTASATVCKLAAQARDDAVGVGLVDTPTSENPSASAALLETLSAILEDTCGAIIDERAVGDINYEGIEENVDVSAVTMDETKQQTPADIARDILSSPQFSEAMKAVKTAARLASSPDPIPLPKLSDTSAAAAPAATVSLFDQLDSMADFSYVPPSSIVEAYDAAQGDLSGGGGEALSLLEKIEPADLAQSEHWPRVRGILREGLSSRAGQARGR